MKVGRSPQDQLQRNQDQPGPNSRITPDAAFLHSEGHVLPWLTLTGWVGPRGERVVPRRRVDAKRVLRCRYGRTLGVFVRSFAGHCSESSGKSRSLPVIRSTVRA